MPQLDEAFYPSQLFWLATTFALLYIVLAAFVLPRLKRIQEQRADANQGRRKQAEQATMRAEQALQNYESKLAEHKNLAQAESQKLRQQTDEQLKKQKESTRQSLDDKIQQAEKEIAAFLPAGHEQAKQAAITATQEIVQHLTGQEIAAEDAQRAVQRAQK